MVLVLRTFLMRTKVGSTPHSPGASWQALGLWRLSDPRWRSLRPCSSLCERWRSDPLVPDGPSDREDRSTTDTLDESVLLDFLSWDLEGRSSIALDVFDEMAASESCCCRVDPSSSTARATRVLELRFLRRRSVTWCGQEHHAHPPSCFADRQRTTFHTSLNKRCFMWNVTWKNAHSCNRLTSKVSSHQLTSFLASKSTWEGHWDSAWRKTTAHEVTDRRMPCSAQVRLHTEAGMRFNFVCYEILPGIGRRAECMQPLLRRS